MSNISQFISGYRKKNRRIIHGGVSATTITWLVPPGITEVEVHCWGAGANGSSGIPVDCGGGGGGGGYVTHVFPVTPTDVLQITAGASPGGTSSVSVPTQSPISPISATGGSNTGTVTGGAGGSGAFTIAPGISTTRTFIASGGFGGSRGGGGAAGSPFGPGGNGGDGIITPAPAITTGGGGGGGIGGPGFPGLSGPGGGSLGAGVEERGGLGIGGYKAGSWSPVGVIYESKNNINWFYVDEILGGGGSNVNYVGLQNGNDGGGGAAGSDTTSTGGGGILGGGGGGVSRSFPSVQRSAGNGGLGGGGGGSGPTAPTIGIGGAGLVILYW